MASPSPSRAELLAEIERLRAGSGEQALRQVVHELEVHQEELRSQQLQLLDTQRALEEARDRYAELFDFAPVAYIVVDAHGVIFEANVGAEQMFGIERSRLLTKTLTRFVDRDCRDAAMRHLGRCRAGLRAETELSLRQEDGTMLPVQLISSPAHAADGQELFHTAVVDLTERRRSDAERTRTLADQQRLLQEEQVARAASDAKDRFIAMLSHELRTPLAPILFALEAARTRGGIPEPLRPTLEMVRRNILLETRLIDDLLDMTRIVQGKMSIVREVIDLHEAITDVLTLCQEQLERSPADKRIALAAAAHTVYADPVRLRQVIWNLVNNAVRNTPAGGEIAVSTSNPASDTIAIVVSDTGRGIDQQLLARIFTFFEQDDESRRRGMGLGLGLAISKAIVESHGGRISAESDGPGHGARFTVSLATVADTPHAAAGQPRRDAHDPAHCRFCWSRTIRTAPPRSPSSSS
jgi:PAS domain S-box-containing protein